MNKSFVGIALRTIAKRSIAGEDLFNTVATLALFISYLYTFYANPHFYQYSINIGLNISSLFIR